MIIILIIQKRMAKHEDSFSDVSDIENELNKIGRPKR